MALEVIILAAGQGKRMLSTKPKVLHELAGKTMIRRVVETALSLEPQQVHVIVGPQQNAIQESLTDLSINWVTQQKPLGTGHAVLQAMPDVDDDNQVIILSADVPLIESDTLMKLSKTLSSDGLTAHELGLMVAKVDDPFGLGRIVRDGAGRVIEIVEEKDTNVQQKTIKEIYTGICIADASALRRWLPLLSNNNAQSEYYLTEIIALAVAEEQAIQTITIQDQNEVAGVNNRRQLNQLERAYQLKMANRLMDKGVTLADANRIDIRGTLICEQDVTIDINCVFEGQVHIASNTAIGSNCYLRNVTIESGSVIAPNSVLEDCHIGRQCEIGPFARIRPGTKLDENCKIGNFVETKKAHFGQGSKANHLSYLGDVTIGRKVNIGAGTITCNYDGANKHQTIIEDGAFIGSDTQLVAPVTIGKNATIGAGSTIRKDAPHDALTLSESKQKTVSGWKRPEKVEKMV